MIEKVISGGQTGADIAGLRAARTAGIPTGGFIPRGYKTQDGPHPEYESLYNLVEIESDNYAERTRLNVMQSDCTIRFAFDLGTPGERCTLASIRGYAKPYTDFGTNALTVENTNNLVKWLTVNEFKIINIAGNSEKRYKGIEDLVYKFLVPVFERVQFDSEPFAVFTTSPSGATNRCNYCGTIYDNHHVDIEEIIEIGDGCKYCSPNTEETLND